MSRKAKIIIAVILLEAVSGLSFPVRSIYIASAL